MAKLLLLKVQRWQTVQILYLHINVVEIVSLNSHIVNAFTIDYRAQSITFASEPASVYWSKWSSECSVMDILTIWDVHWTLLDVQ